MAPYEHGSNTPQKEDVEIAVDKQRVHELSHLEGTSHEIGQLFHPIAL